MADAPCPPLSFGHFPRERGNPVRLPVFEGFDQGGAAIPSLVVIAAFAKKNHVCVDGVGAVFGFDRSAKVEDRSAVFDTFLVLGFVDVEHGSFAAAFFSRGGSEVDGGGMGFVEACFVFDGCVANAPEEQACFYATREGFHIVFLTGFEAECYEVITGESFGAIEDSCICIGTGNWRVAAVTCRVASACDRQAEDERDRGDCDRRSHRLSRASKSAEQRCHASASSFPSHKTTMLP